ncbi:hypothetical protein QT519_05615 [Pseudomonas aeruginosa]|nr:hypothetical protein [Pseudomonas aeruginosa]MDM5014431.1 hypothetical protein [Pseudomonas aeruginosa]
MATEFGTATNHQNLVERLVQFLTANPDLVAAGQAYEKVFDNSIPASGTAIAVRQVTLRAPGLGGTDSIYIDPELRRYGTGSQEPAGRWAAAMFNAGAIPPGGDFWTTCQPQSSRPGAYAREPVWRRRIEPFADRLRLHRRSQHQNA